MSLGLGSKPSWPAVGSHRSYQPARAPGAYCASSIRTPAQDEEGAERRLQRWPLRMVLPGISQGTLESNNQNCPQCDLWFDHSKPPHQGRSASWVTPVGEGNHAGRDAWGRPGWGISPYPSDANTYGSGPHTLG